MKTAPEEWDRRFMRLAEEVAAWSKDPTRKIGAVVVSPDRRQFATGYNGFPPAIPDHEEVLLDPHWKNRLTVHAEQNALQNAMFDTQGATLYVTRFPCNQCAKAILAARIGRVVCPPIPDESSKWFASWLEARALFEYARIPLHHLS